VELVAFEGSYYVLKAFDRDVVAENCVRREQVMNERDLLKRSSCPGLNKLVQTTKDDKWLCLLLELAEGLDTVGLLRAYQRLSADIVKHIIL